MGWLFTPGQTRTELIARLTKTDYFKGQTSTCLRHCARGNVLWTVWEIILPNSEIHKYIGCDLMQCQKGCGWGYKDMCEADGPYYWSCPVSYLEMVPVRNEDWRQEVMRRDALKQMPLAAGDLVILKGFTIPQLALVEKKGRSWLGTYGGRIYSLPPRYLSRITSVVQTKNLSTPQMERSAA